MLSELLQSLEEHADREKAAQMKKYMRGQFEYYGIQTGQRINLSKGFLDSFKNSEWSIIQDIVRQLWSQPHRECQQVAMNLLSKHLKKFKREDVKLIEYLILSKSWWDTVDWLASHAIGDLFLLYPDIRNETIEKWSDSRNIWLVRTCLIFQLFYKLKTDTIVLEREILKHATGNEFFINKAAGWALRQYSKSNPEWVISFLEKNQSTISKLSVREAKKWIDKNYKVQTTYSDTN